MPFVEIIYETGNKSVAYYETDEEMQSALSEHHRRAINGEPGTSQSALRNDLNPGETRIGSWVAERIKDVLIYDQHPADYGEDQLMDVADVKKVFNDTIKESEMQGVVHVQTVAAAIRDMSNSMVPEPKAHESQFKMEETAKADLSFLKAVE